MMSHRSPYKIEYARPFSIYNMFGLIDTLTAYDVDYASLVSLSYTCKAYLPLKSGIKYSDFLTALTYEQPRLVKYLLVDDDNLTYAAHIPTSYRFLMGLVVDEDDFINISGSLCDLIFEPFAFEVGLFTRIIEYPDHYYYKKNQDKIMQLPVNITREHIMHFDDYIYKSPGTMKYNPRYSVISIDCEIKDLMRIIICLNNPYLYNQWLEDGGSWDNAVDLVQFVLEMKQNYPECLNELFTGEYGNYANLDYSDVSKDTYREYLTVIASTAIPKYMHYICSPGTLLEYEIPCTLRRSTYNYAYNAVSPDTCYKLLTAPHIYVHSIPEVMIPALPLMCGYQLIHIYRAKGEFWHDWEKKHIIGSLRNYYYSVGAGLSLTEFTESVKTLKCLSCLGVLPWDENIYLITSETKAYFAADYKRKMCLIKSYGLSRPNLSRPQFKALPRVYKRVLSKI